ncbi:MAG: GGDEF domain-containing protein [Polyangiales bacterium]
MGRLANKLREGNALSSGGEAPDDRWGALLVPRELVEEHPRSRDRAFLLVRYTVIAAIFTACFSPYFFVYLKLPYTLLLNLLYLVSLAATLVILRRMRSLRIAANWTLSSAFGVLLFQSCVLGGVSALAYPWLACLPVAAMLLRGVRGGAVWTFVTMGGVIGIGIADAMGLLPASPTMSGTARGATTVTIASLTVALGALAWLAESRADELLSDLQLQKQVFQERAVRDWLTGLANRSLLTECLIQSWERARRHGPRGALFFIDLNDFKLVNDEHGHSAGDQVLRKVALRLQDTVRSSDLVGRIGGDEFALIIEGVESRNDVAVLADKIAEAIERPIGVGDTEVHVGASIGVAFFPDRDCQFDDRVTLPSIPANPAPGRGEVDHESVRRLFEKADAAMYTAKRKALRYWIHEHVADETLRSTTSLVSEPPPAA